MDNYKENRGDEYQKMGFLCVYMFAFIFLATMFTILYDFREKKNEIR